MAKRKLVVIGNGMAGVRTVEEILALAPDRFEITIFGKEPHPNYNRILLSKVLQGDTTIDSITLNSREWYQHHGITLYTDEPVVAIDTEKRYVKTAKGRTEFWDELIIATGSLPFMLPLPGTNKEGVTAFRDISDCEKMIETSQKYKKATVIGGGLLGLEAARGLLNLGMSVDVVHIGEYLMERQLDPMAADMLKKELESQGMHFLLQKNTAELTGHKRVKGIRFTDGTWRETDLVVMAVGVRPNVQVVEQTAISVKRAIVVDDHMETNIPGVYAVGECAEHRGVVYGLVAPLYEQGKALAARLCGKEHPGYQGSVLSTQLKVSGVDVFSAGEFMETDETDSLYWYNGVKGTYKKVVVREGKVAGAVLFGDSKEGTGFLEHIKKKTPWAEIEQEMAGASEDLIGKMADHELVCTCNGVTKGQITEAICANSLQHVDEIKACTKASSSCGGCRPLVEELLLYVQENGAEPAKTPICACTEADHHDVIQAIEKGDHQTAASVMACLGWKTENGCHICRPAIHYYMTKSAPAEPAIAKKMRQALAGKSLPSRVSVAASNSVDDGSHALEASVGFIYAPGGWELSVEGQRLYTGMTEEEAFRFAEALLADYAQFAFYKESVGKWLERTGPVAVREKLFHVKQSENEAVTM